VLNPAGLRRLLLLTPLFFLDFWWNFRAQMRREWGVGSLYKGGRQAPLPRPWAGPSGRPRGGDSPPCRPLGGRPAPCRRVLARDLFENKKFYRKVPVAHCLGDRCLSPPRWATGGYFCNLLKRPYIFEILFFLKYKKEKSRFPRGNEASKSQQPSHRAKGPARQPTALPPQHGPLKALLGPSHLSAGLPPPSPTSSVRRRVAGGGHGGAPLPS